MTPYALLRRDLSLISYRSFQDLSFLFVMRFPILTAGFAIWSDQFSFLPGEAACTLFSVFYLGMCSSVWQSIRLIEIYRLANTMFAGIEKDVIAMLVEAGSAAGS